jgi:pimeloyl-ACP methyl ester carboxylesterase
MEEDAASIRTAILSIIDHPTNPQNVVLAPHSYGGFPASEACIGLAPSARAASGKTTAVVGLVYIASFLPVEGESSRDITSRNKSMPPDLQAGNPGGYLPPIPAEFASAIFNDVEDPAEAASLHATMVSQSSDSFSGKVTYAAWREVKTVYVIPGADLIIPVEMQEDMYERAREITGGKVKRWFIEGSGHCPVFTRAEEVVKAMISVLQD